jgi:hypothetical protein
MKVRLKIEKGNAILFDQVYEIGDAEAFGRACSHAWAQMREQRWLAPPASVPCSRNLTIRCSAISTAPI